MVATPPKLSGPTGDQRGPNIPATKGYRQRGGRPGLNVDFVAVCDAIREAWAGIGGTVLPGSRLVGVGYTSGFTQSWGTPFLAERRIRLAHDAAGWVRATAGYAI